MESVQLHEEFRLIERNESEVNVAWKGAHLLLFFLAFVFGSFCTFCFHVLMYMFNQKCVLFPKLVYHQSLRNIINDFYPTSPNKKYEDPELPVDFLSTQWVDESVCYVPTYVPLVSGIFGLVWTTMFLMCTSGSRTFTGMQRPWRVLPPVFLFSVAMSGVCFYASTITHDGLQELCDKLAEATGSSSCTYTVNVATLTYERRIRGVYQATQLTIISAWLHTSCWILSALLTLARFVLAVDFQLVRVTAHLVGNIDRMLEKYETHIRSISPEGWIENDPSSASDTIVYSANTEAQTQRNRIISNGFGEMTSQMKKIYVAAKERKTADTMPVQFSDMSLVPEERNKLSRLSAYRAISKNHQFIVKMVFDLIDFLDLSELPASPELGSETSSSLVSQSLIRQFGQENIYAHHSLREISIERVREKEIEALSYRLNGSDEASTSREQQSLQQKSFLNLIQEMSGSIENNLQLPISRNVGVNVKAEPVKKSNLKQRGIQTDDKRKQKVSRKVQISDSFQATPVQEKYESDSETSQDQIDGHEATKQENKDTFKEIKILDKVERDNEEKKTNDKDKSKHIEIKDSDVYQYDNINLNKGKVEFDDITQDKSNQSEKANKTNNDTSGSDSNVDNDKKVKPLKKNKIDVLSPFFILN